MAWRNGYIPESDLVIFKRGYNGTDGNWFWGLTPGTYARHLALVALAHEKTGRVLSPSDGWGTYRPYDAQVIARRVFGNGAAVPGTSSHGGFWEGRETLAIDYSNWSFVYGGDRAAFYADCRAVGLTPGMIEPRRGYPDEPWHVIDLNPRSGAPAPAADTATPLSKGPLMALSDAEQTELLNNTRQVYNAFFKGGPSMDDEGRSAAFSLSNITEFLDRIDKRLLAIHQATFDGGPSMPDDGKSIGQSLADLRSELATVRAALPASGS